MRRTIFIILALIPILIFSWGRKVHYYTTLRAMNILSTNFGVTFKSSIDYVADNASLADQWKMYDRNEGPNHYCDYENFLSRKKSYLDQPFKTAVRMYGVDFLRDNGTVIWALDEYYKLLVRALEEKNFSSALVYMAIVSHYIEDIHQPFHTTRNYDGQLTGNVGIHARYEINMMDLFWEPKVLDSYNKISEFDGKNPRFFAVSIIKDSSRYVNGILKADCIARDKTNRVYNDEYLKILWDNTSKMTNERTGLAAERVAGFILAAWKAAGSPEFPSDIIKLKGTINKVERPVFFKDNSQHKHVNKGSASDLLRLIPVLLFAGLIIFLKNQ